MASVTVRVRSKGDFHELDELAHDLASKPVAEREYLTHEQLAARYGADEKDLDAIEAYAQQHDLQVVDRSAGERSIVLRGRLGDLLAAFPADVQLYHHGTGTYRGRTGEVSIPEQLADVITGVFGFDTRAKRRSSFTRKRASMAAGGANGVAATVFATRYAFPERSADGTALDGSGQTIAIIELGGGFRAADLKTFFREIGVPTPAVSAISVDHARNKPVGDPNSADGEVMLDIEVAGAVVPKAKIAVYFGPNSGDTGFVDAIRAAVHDSVRKPSVVSISWGEPEDLLDQQGIQAYHELFVEAATLGVTICVAAGDHGTADEDAAHWDGKIHVDHPSADPNVLSCGGTQIDATNTDVVWNDGTAFDKSTGQGGWAGGGGISVLFPVPDYQAAANTVDSLVTGKPGRGVPDIAMSATNYYTRVDGSEGPSGGTSAVAPLMAALIARLNQATGKNVGFINPLLYENAAAFTDVTAGTNAITGTVQGYDAAVGWDPCTGLGTPIGTAILASVTAILAKV
jgi:kumamolisin